MILEYFFPNQNNSLKLSWQDGSNDGSQHMFLWINMEPTAKTLNIGTPRPATVVVLNIKQFNFTMK